MGLHVSTNPGLLPVAVEFSLHGMVIGYNDCPKAGILITIYSFNTALYNIARFLLNIAGAQESRRNSPRKSPSPTEEVMDRNALIRY
jgi:hypothetical protein